MKHRILIGGVEYVLNPAVISNVRYYSEYSSSYYVDFIKVQSRHEQIVLRVKMAYCMIEGPQPDFKDFAMACRKDEGFIETTDRAFDELLKRDTTRRAKKQPDDIPKYNEFEMLARAAKIGIPGQLIYELPAFQIEAIMGYYYDLMDPGRKQYVKMSRDQMKSLYNM